LRQAAVDAVIGGLKRAGVSVVCYLPDSLFKELYPALDSDPDIRTVRVTNEGEGAAICGGVFLSGKRAALIMENSGLRAAIEHLARLGLGAGIDDAYTARTVAEFSGLCEQGLRSERPFVIVAKVDSTAGQSLRQRALVRKQSDGREDKHIFVRPVEETEGIVIMGPSEHN
jgi:thiamine pyrophosphate-dependent acetolactate synthase large subunit-like protein